jgi:SAM-dependent methyltransferase
VNDIVLRWISEKSEAMELVGPVVEFGSLQVVGQEGYADLRRFFAGLEYTGCDIQPGPGVDSLADIERSGIDAGSVGTVVCLETLEHVRHPWLAMAEILRILKPGGVALFSVPFHHPLHGFPHDYWRMTPAAMRLLLLDAGFEEVEVGDSGETVLWEECWDKSVENPAEPGQRHAMPCPLMTFATARKPAEQPGPAPPVQAPPVDEAYFLARIDDLAEAVAGRDEVISGLREDLERLARYKDTLEAEISSKDAEMERASGYARNVEAAYGEAQAKLESAKEQLGRLNEEIARLRARLAD